MGMIFYPDILRNQCFSQSCDRQLNSSKFSFRYLSCKLFFVPNEKKKIDWCRNAVESREPSRKGKIKELLLNSDTDYSCSLKLFSIYLRY